MAANTDMFTPVGLLFSPLKVANLVKNVFEKTSVEQYGMINKSDEIYEIRVRNIWIIHGFFAAIGLCMHIINHLH